MDLHGDQADKTIAEMPAVAATIIPLQTACEAMRRSTFSISRETQVLRESQDASAQASPQAI
jgi:hypothetical protein